MLNLEIRQVDLRRHTGRHWLRPARNGIVVAPLSSFCPAMPKRHWVRCDSTWGPLWWTRVPGEERSGIVGNSNDHAWTPLEPFRYARFREFPACGALSACRIGILTKE